MLLTYLMDSVEELGAVWIILLEGGWCLTCLASSVLGT